jgi:DNA-binding transcriptional MerR regulator
MLKTRDVAELFGMSMRQIDYWARTGLVEPTVKAEGIGSSRGWSVEDALKVGVAVRLVEAGVPTRSVRRMVEEFEKRGGWRHILDAEYEVGITLPSMSVLWIDVPAIRRRVEARLSEVSEDD